MARLLIPLAVLFCALGVFVSLDKPAPRADLVFVSRADVFTLDPQRMSYLQDFRLGDAIYEGLVRWDNVSRAVIPAACESWSVSDDGLVYTFHLRPDARWSNGDPLTAHDFVYTWRRAILPDTAADFASMTFIIKGARAMMEWRGAQLAELARANQSAADLWKQTERQFAETVGLRALDANTLEITLEQPVPFVLDVLSFGVFLPVHRPTVEGWELSDAQLELLHERGWREEDCPPFEQCRFVSLDSASGRLQQSHEWTKPGRIVTNGPYVLTRWRYKRDMRLEANPLYHSPASVKSKSIDIPSLPDANASILAFESGVIDWHTDAAIEYQADMIAQQRRYEARHQSELDSLLAQGLSRDQALAQLPPPQKELGERRDLHVLPAFGTDFYSFNCRATLASGAANVFADARVRRAFAMAIDKPAIAQQVTRIGEPVASVLVPRDAIEGYESPDGLPYDPVAARHLLAEVGWSDRNGDGVIENSGGDQFPTVEVLYSTNSPRYRNISLALRDMWQRELGVHVELRGLETKFFREALKRGDFMVARGGWFGDFGDPTTFLDICATGSGTNDRGYSNPVFDQLLAHAAGESDPRKRFELLREAERILVEEDLPLVPICQYALIYLYDPARVRGITHHPRLQQYLHQIEVLSESRPSGSGERATASDELTVAGPPLPHGRGSDSIGALP